MQRVNYFLLCTFICHSVLGQIPLHRGSINTIPAKNDSLIQDIQDNVLDNIPVISLDDNGLSDAATQNISSLLTAGKDPFYTAASFNFSVVHFRTRGFDADLSGVYINGVPMNNLDNGFTPYGLWGGLNDVMHNRDVSIGLRYNTYAFGDIAGVTNIDTRASKQIKQTNFSYAYSNRSYNHRWTFTHSTGAGKKGWAFTISGSRRWAGEGYAPGTFYNGWSYFAGIDKRFGQKHLLSLVAFGAPTENGKQAGSVSEMMDLAGSHYYNPYWGYQDGKMRNAYISKTNQPVIILTHDYRINSNSSLVTALAYSFGEKSSSGLDWYNAGDPRPDYYRYLPSYQTDSIQALLVADELRNNEAARQINWQHLYDVNRDSYATIYDANGIAGNNVSGHRSYYIVHESVTDTRRLNFNSVINSRLGNHADFTAGASFQWQKNNYFERVNDLLGGDFYVDLNQFAQRDFPTDINAAQNDLSRPNRILHAGDKYGYNYDITIYKASEWAQTVFKFNKIDFFLAAEASQTQFYRTGNVKNGLFPDNSYGKSKINIFTNYAVKGGITYKINGRNYLYANAALLTRAPYFDNAYISARSRDIEQDSLVSEDIQDAEAGYVLNAPKLKIRLTGYYATFKHGFDVLTFYHDDYRNFVNYALSNIDKIHYGGEFGIEAKIMSNVSVTGAAAVGRYYYSSRQNAVVTLDNSAKVLDRETVYSQNFRVPSTPQEAYSLGITYRSPKFWFLSLTGNYFDQMWLSFNPLRRTYSATEGVDPESRLWNDIIDQAKFDPQYTLDFFAGYSWKLPHSFNINKKPVFLVFNAGVNNLLNNRDIVTGGYEQLRFDFADHDINKFPPKLYYAYGLNYFISAAIHF